MEQNWKISNQQILLLLGFLFFSLGLLGIIQVGLLEGLIEIIPLSLIILIVGISFLVVLLMIKPNT